MFQNYFKIGWRNLLRNKGYSFINIGGLATGMAVTMLIGLWVYDEVSFDKYHEHYGRIAQVLQHQTFNGATGTEHSIPRPLEMALLNEYGSDFQYLSMATWTGDHILSSGEQKITASGNFFQADFPEMLSLKMLKGTRRGLKGPSSILLSAATAEALFGDKDPVNQPVRIGGDIDAIVTGVYEDLPYNTTFNNLAFMASWELFVNSEEWVKGAADQWGNNSFQLFAMMAPGADMSQVSEKIKNIKAKSDQHEVALKPEVFLSPMHNWHLRSEWRDGKNIGGRIQQVWLFGVIGLFVLLLACINFMNLSTARSEKRGKEVGIRMTIGSVRSQLINQFLSESFLVVVLAFVVAMGLVVISLPWFNDLADKKMIITWSNPVFCLISIVFILFTSLLAGSYPALYLSSFRPVSVLKGTFRAGRFASIPRKVLVVIQFTVSVTLIIGTIIVHRQIQFTKSRPVGYNREGLIMIEIRSPEFHGKYDVLRTELKNTGAVEEISESSSPVMSIWSNNGGFSWKGKNPDLHADFATIWVSPEHGRTIGWKIKEGRDLSREFSTDSTAVVLNEAAVKFMDVKDPVGMELDWNGRKLHVVGVIKDMIMKSPYSPEKQTIYLSSYEDLNWINLRLSAGKPVVESLASIEAVFKKHTPSVPFDYRFADKEYAKKFAVEERIGMLASVFAVLAIFISCLGISGLASFVAEQRTKEIGIRKVLGATVINLWRMLSKDFVVLVMIACVIAIPVACYLLLNWLQQYEYHTDISWWIPGMTGLGALLITLITVSYQAVKAALMNPVKSLRSE
jgi:putative ABC transport system permease protein